MTLCVHQNIGGFDISVDDLQLVLEESKTPYDVGRYPSQYVFGNAGTLDFIQTAGIHELHAVIDARLYEEGAVKLDDFWSDCSMEDV